MDTSNKQLFKFYLTFPIANIIAELLLSLLQPVQLVGGEGRGEKGKEGRKKYISVYFKCMDKYKIFLSVFKKKEMSHLKENLNHTPALITHYCGFFFRSRCHDSADR